MIKASIFTLTPHRVLLLQIDSEMTFLTHLVCFVLLHKIKLFATDSINRKRLNEEVCIIIINYLPKSRV